jgi:transcription elongation factor GreA
LEHIPEMTLLELAENGQLETIDERWLELLEAPGDVTDAVAALHRLVQNGWTDRAAPLALMLAESLLAANRHADALDVLRPVAGHLPEEESLRKQLLAAVRGKFAGELWVETFVEVSGLAAEAPTGKALARLEHMIAHEPGRVVLNAAGWGLGVIDSRMPTGRLMVRFPDGAVRPFDPHQFEERLKLLDPGDFRALKVQAPERLARMVQDDHVALVRAVAAARGGAVNSLELRDELIDAGLITKSKWTTFWKKAREAVNLDPLLSVEGSSTRPRLILRERPVTIEEEAEHALSQAADDQDAARIVDSYIEKGVEDASRDRLLQALSDRILPDAAERGTAAAAGALAALLVLEKHGGSGAQTPEEVLRTACPAGGSTILDLVRAADDSRLEEGLVRLMGRAWGPEAIDRLIRVYADLPRSVQDAACDVVLEVGGAEHLSDVMDEMLRLPYRNAEPLLALTKAWSAGAFAEVDGAPTSHDLLHGLLPILAGLARATGERFKLFKAWHQAVSGKRNSLLDRLLETVSEEEDARHVLTTLDMYWETPDDIAAWIRGDIHTRFPHLAEHVDTQFWDQPVIYCTHEGISRRKEELRVLVDEKIPENAKAIGRAASFGDLSENAEWQAAIEERGILSQRAEELRAEVDKARPLENAPIPKGIVAPGCRVRLLERGGDGTQREMLLLGPWDEGDERIISYLSPLAMGLLGTPVGEEVTVELPTGKVTWRVLEVEKAV